MKKALVGMTLILLSVSTLALTFDVQRVGAIGTIYIRADGSIDPPTAPISSLGNFTYAFNGNINDSIVIERDNIVVDGADYVLRGTGTYGSIGISMMGRENVTVRKMEIGEFYYGIYLNGSSYCSVIGNCINGNCWLGLRLLNSSNNVIFENNVTNNGYGIYLSASSSNILQSNRMCSNVYNFFVDGWLMSHFMNDIGVSNTVNGRPVYFWVNESDRDIPPDAGYVAIVNCTQINVHNLSLSENNQGVVLAYTENSTIAGNNITSNSYGITLIESSDNAVGNNTVKCDDGIWLARNSSHNRISGNNIMNSKRGIFLYSSSDNEIYHNNFMNNTLQVQDASSIDPDVPQSINVWDGGYPSGGNYWGDYLGADLHSGPCQNETGSDGIGDNPYVIDENNRDRYPLTVPDVAVTSVAPFRTVVGQSFNASINVTVANQGDHIETYNVTLYADLDMAINETGMVGYWKFDEGSGPTVHDSSGNGNDGTIHGAEWVQGKNGSALGFDGIDDYVEVLDSPELNPSSLTVMAWVNFRGFPDPIQFPDPISTVLAKGTNDTVNGFYSLSQLTRNPEHLCFEITEGNTWHDVVGTTHVAEGTWYHIAGTYDGHVQRLYVNGVLEDTDILNTPRTTNNTMNLQIGAQRMPGWEYWLNGTIDEVKIYNRALDEEEILAHATHLLRHTYATIGKEAITLSGGNSTTITFTWNTTGFAKGNYTLSAYALPVPGEVATADNNFTDGLVKVTIPGDVTGDFKVSMDDIVVILDAFGSRIGLPRYNANYDIDNNLQIDMGDVVIALDHFGQHYP